MAAQQLKKNKINEDSQVPTSVSRRINISKSFTRAHLYEECE